MFPPEFSSRSIIPLGFEGVCLLALFFIVCAGSVLLHRLSLVAAGGSCSSLWLLTTGASLVAEHEP